MNYEKKYNEALEVMRQWIAPCHTKEQLDTLKKSVFPELAESEDERIRRTLVEYFGPKVQLDFVRGVPIQKIRDWLEKQKEQKPEEKSEKPIIPEWSEEDEAMRDNILRLLSCFVGTLECDSNPSLSTSYPAYQREMDWLKSLRPSWKPSEEQMDALEAATVRYQSTGLESLYEDLKKLK